MLILPAILSACQKDETISGYADTSARYRLEERNGAPAAAALSLSFPAQGEVAGQGPCNSFTARQTAPYPWIEITNLAATRKACPDLAAETGLFTDLQAMTLVEAQGDVLILSNDDGDQLVFRAASD